MDLAIRGRDGAMRLIFRCSPVAIMREVLDGVVERKWGRIVNIAAVAAKFPRDIMVLPGMHHSAIVGKQFGERAATKGTTYE